jgi:hypothetical protein
VCAGVPRRSRGVFAFALLRARIDGSLSHY